MNQTNKKIENSQKNIKSGYLGEEGDDVLVYTTNQTNNRIREEWIEKWRWDMSYQQESDLPKMIADWWLSKINELLKSQRDSLVEKIEKYGTDMQGGNPLPTVQQAVIQEVLSIIKNN